MTAKHWRRLILILASVIPSAAHADAGLLPLVVVWPVFLLALIPIVLIETEIFRRRLAGVPYARLFLAVTTGNAVSTILGIPLFVVLLIIGSYLSFWFRSFWVNNLYLFWSLLATGYLIPAYFVSVHSEAFVIRKMLRTAKEAVLPVSRVANLWSYGILLVIFFGYALMH